MDSLAHEGRPADLLLQDVGKYSGQSNFLGGGTGVGVLLSQSGDLFPQGPGCTIKITGATGIRPVIDDGLGMALLGGLNQTLAYGGSLS